MQYYERIRKLRERANERQEDIANLLGITRPQYYLYESGKRKFPIEHIMKLCDHFNVSADYLLGLPEGRPYGKSE